MLGIRFMLRTGWIPHFSPCDSVTWGFTHIVNITNHSFRASKSKFPENSSLKSNVYALYVTHW